MKIFVFTPSYPNDRNPIANLFVKEQVDALVQLGHEVVVLSIYKEPSRNLFKKIDKGFFRKTDNATVVFKRQKTLWESKLHYVNQIAINHSFKELYNYAISKFWIPDVIYAHFMSAGYAAGKLETGIPIVVYEHSGNIMRDNISLFEKVCLKKVVLDSSKYIVSSDSLKKAVYSHIKCSKPILTIPNMVADCFHYYPYVNDDNSFSFFSLTRFDFDKRLDLLVRAFCAAFDSEDAVTLMIGGTGKEFHNIKKLIDKNERENQIKLLGRLDQSSALEYYKKCSCFVLPSRHETFGIVWREALCVGRPIITTNHGGFCEEDFNEQYGLMVSVDNFDELVNALIHMKEHFDIYDLETISSQNLKQYSADSIARRIEMVLLEAMHECH